MQRQTTFQDDRANLTHRLENIHQNRHPTALLLDGVQDIRNIAALFRLADAARLTHIYLYQSADLKPQFKKINRIARQTLQYVPYTTLTQLDDIPTVYEWLALEKTTKSVVYTDSIVAKEAVLLVLGNEQHGVSEATLARCTKAIHIPMQGVNTSMNVSMAAAIVTFYLLSHYEKE